MSAATVWLAAVGGRLAYLTHRLRGHETTWTGSRADATHCALDITCHTCARVLWCRAYDPWRRIALGGVAHERGARRVVQGPSTLFDNLQQVLRLASEWPSGRSGDALLRAACELTEAGSVRQQQVRRTRMMKMLRRIQSRPVHGRCRDSDPRRRLSTELRNALDREVRDAPTN